MSDPPSVWCLVANVTREPHPEGVDGELWSGTKHFAPGAKLYCYPYRWGDGGRRLRVLGRHRGGSKLVETVISSKWLTEWRVSRVFHPHVVRLMDGAWDDSEKSRMAAEEMATALRGR
jgi:hypothetical protein